MASTVPQRFLETVTRNGDVVALHGADGDAPWTYRDYADQVAVAVAGLAALGVRTGGRVALMMHNRREFHVADTAVQFLGATPFSLYGSASPEEVVYAVEKSNATLAIVENETYASRFDLASERSGELRRVVIEGSTPGTIAWSDITNASEPADLSSLAAATTPDGYATIIFTSGTTGPAKAAIITHANVCAAADAVAARTGITDLAGLSLISYLPMAHIAERLVSHYAPLLYGLTVHPLDDIARFNEFAQTVQPDIVFGVPRVWEKLQQGVLAAVAADPGQATALDDGIVAARHLLVASRLGALTKEQQDTWDFLDAVAFSTVRQRTGLANTKFAVSGAAPISPDLVEWFQAMRIPLSEIYGMSESTGVISWEAARPQAGTVGRPLDGLDVNIADDGEILVRGPVVFPGYLDDPDRTAETLVDGWLHTGDIGSIDDDGFLRIVDRKKELIITAGGENVSPGNLEAALKTIPLVENVCVVGDRQRFPAALVTLDPEQLLPWASAHGLDGLTVEELATEPAVREAVQRGLDEVNERFTRAYQVKRFVLLPDQWLPNSDLMTPTFKLKRRGIAARYAEEIASMYSD